MDVDITAVPLFNCNPHFLSSDFRSKINLSPYQMVVLRDLPCREFFIVFVCDPSFSICAVEDVDAVDQPLLGHVVTPFHDVHFLHFVEVIIWEYDLPPLVLPSRDVIIVEPSW